MFAQHEHSHVVTGHTPPRRLLRRDCSLVVLSPHPVSRWVAVLGTLLTLPSVACSGSSDAAYSLEEELGASDDSGAARDDEHGVAFASEDPSLDRSALYAGTTLDYADERLWLCGAGTDDVCLDADLATTEVRADGSLHPVAGEPVRDPAFDCFYVYPTVDMRREPGSVALDSVHHVRGDATSAVRRQAAHFRSVCRVYAPLYRQMTQGAYLDAWAAGQSHESTDEFGTAYGDVAAAFDHYMETHNAGRGIVFIGHGQGSHVLARLLTERFDESTPSQLISAVLVGATPSVLVPDGEVVGGTFQKLPLCEAADQTGCVISFNSEAAGLEAKRPESVLVPDEWERACTNPASLAGGAGLLAAAYWSDADGRVHPEEVTTPWTAYPELYSAECGAGGGLQIAVAADDSRTPLFHPKHLQALWELVEHGFALHHFDFTFALGDLLHIVTRQGAAYVSR